MMESRLKKQITRKNVVYITVKNRDYIRTRQIERILKEYTSSFDIYSSEKGNPLSRMLDLRKRVRDICFEKYDIVIVGFLPQLIWGSIKKCLYLKYKNNHFGIDNKKDYHFPIDNPGRPFIIAEMFLSLFDTVVLDRKLFWKYGVVSDWCRSLDRKVLKDADLVLTDTKADADFFAREFTADRQKMEVLYLEADIQNEEIAEAENAHDTSKSVVHSSKCPKTIIYFGTGLPLQGTDVVVKAYQLLNRQEESFGSIVSGENDKYSTKEAFNLVYIGGTDHFSRRQRRFIKSDAVEYHKWLPEPELLSKIKAADICLAGHFNASIDKADRTIPGKAFIYEALHKQMILGDTRANREIFTQDENHIFVDRGNAEALAKCIRRSQ